MLEKNKIEIQSGQIINKMGGGGEREEDRRRAGS